MLQVNSSSSSNSKNKIKKQQAMASGGVSEVF